MPDWRDYLPLADDALLAQCDVDHYRASGPGGQKRNKTDSAVRLRHRPTALVGEAVEERSQHLNQARALRRLRLEIAYRLRAPSADGTETPAKPFVLPGARDARYAQGVAALFDTLEAHEWRDGIGFRYGMEPTNLQPRCDGCGERFDSDHGLKCRKGGLIIRRHNNVCRQLQQLAEMNWPGTVLEPVIRHGNPMQPARRP